MADGTVEVQGFVAVDLVECEGASIGLLPLLTSNSQQVDRHVLPRCGNHFNLLLIRQQVRVVVGGGKHKLHAMLLGHHQPQLDHQ